MRVTFMMRGTQMKDMLATSLSNYTEAVKKANAQQSLINPWDDTSNYVGAYNIQNMIDELTQFGENASSASNWLTNADTSIQSIIEALTQARDDYAIAGATDTYDAESRKALAEAVSSIYTQILDLANSTYNGRYIFSGYETTTQPFSDSTNSVFNIITKNQNGESVSANVIVKDVYTDMTELATGDYTAQITIRDGIATLELYDSSGNLVVLDSNGSDESGSTIGNKVATSISFEYEAGKVVNTGLGIAIQMPEDLETPTSLVINFTYSAGANISYQGDDGVIYTQISYNQEIAINMPGSSIFTESNLILQGATINTTNGLSATANTLFTNIDGTNVNIGDSITISGTDHNGNTIGTASLIGNSNATLDLTDASEKERTLVITYGDKLYKIVVPQGNYSSTEELANAINSQLKNAEYLGSVTGLSDAEDVTIDDYQAYINNLINSGLYEGETTTDAINSLSVDLSGEINITADGSRLCFTTTRAGDNVRLAVTGTDQSLLGFKGATVASEGKDITFEIGYEFHTETIDIVETTFESFDLSQGGTYTFYINGVEVNVDVPTISTSLSNSTLDPTTGADPMELDVNGTTISITVAEYNDALASATGTQEEAIQDLINEKLSEAGLSGTVYATGVVDNLDGTYNIEFTTVNTSIKELEYAFDQALKEAGFEFEVGVSLTSDPDNVGSYDLTFYLQNYNLDRTTVLTTTYYDNSTIPPTTNMKTADIDKTGMNTAEVQTLGDFMEFIENLYGGTVDVSLEDGKLTITDLRSGDSKLTFRTNAQNQGISHATDLLTTVGGTYTGTKDDVWNVVITTTIGENEQRNIAITVTDKNGYVIYDKVTANYTGGAIEILYGVTITPDDMNLPNELTPDVTEATATFQISLSASPNLSFGTVSTVQTGDNVNIFRSLENLIHALEYNITENGFGEPSSWSLSDLNSTASPYLDGTFQGNFNDNWTYTVQSSNNQSSFYLQNEYTTTTGEIQYDVTAYANNSILTFSVDIYNNDTGEQERVDISIDLSNANITDVASAQSYILQQLNNNTDLVSADLRFIDNDGTIEIQSGSGAVIANFANSASDETSRAFASFVMGFETIANEAIDSDITLASSETFTFQVADPTSTNGGFTEITVTLANGVSSVDELLAEINSVLADDEANGGTDGRITAEITSDGSIIFVLSGTDTQVEAMVEDGANNPLNLSLTYVTDAITGEISVAELTVSGVQTPKTDLSELDSDARTLTFTYTENGRQNTVSITLDQKAYESVQDLADAINEKLASGGLSGLTAVVNSNGELAFMKTNSDITSVTVEGDYDGTLGFPKAGDTVTVKVTDADGVLVQNVTLDTAGEAVYVAEGLYLGFDAGSLNATDSFTAAVGSGVESEIDVLDAAITQVTLAGTLVGTRAQRVESVLTFQETVISTNEEIKASYLGATAIDIVQLTTDLQLAQTAYTTAMSIVTSMLSLSILDFLSS